MKGSGWVSKRGGPSQGGFRVYNRVQGLGFIIGFMVQG